MAYGIKYLIEWRDIDNNQNRIEILQDGYSGAVTSLTPTDTPAVHRYEREDNEDILSPIMASTLTFSFFATDTVDFRSFFSFSDTEFKVVYKFENAIMFQGYVLNDIAGEPFQDPPYPVVITATDGLGQLKEVELSGPSQDTELGELIFEQLNRLNLELDFEVCNDLYEALEQDNTLSIFGQLAENQLKVQAGTFDEIKLSAFDFLSEICKIFGWTLFQHRNRWVIQRPVYANSVAPVRFIHAWDGSGITTETALNIQTVGDQTQLSTTWIPVESDQLLQYQRPFKRLTVIQTGLGQNIITNGTDFNEQSWTLTGTYQLNDWTLNQVQGLSETIVRPANIPQLNSWDDEKGVDWSVRLEANGLTNLAYIESQPVFLDFAGMILDLSIDVEFELSTSVIQVQVKHIDTQSVERWLTTSNVVNNTILTWSDSEASFTFRADSDNQRTTFNLSSFVLPTVGSVSVLIRYFSITGSAIIRKVDLIPTYRGERNPSQVSQVYETTKGYTATREEEVKFSDVIVTRAKNWLRIGDFPAIVFVEKSLAGVPDIIQTPSGVLTQINRLTDTQGINTVSGTPGDVTGDFQRIYTADAGFTILTVIPTITPFFGAPMPPNFNIVINTINSQQTNVTVQFNNSDPAAYFISIEIILVDANGNFYQRSTFGIAGNIEGGEFIEGLFDYALIDLSFEGQATLSSYSPTLRDTYARQLLSIYNALSFRLEGSFRRKGTDFGWATQLTNLNYTGYSGVKMQVIGWDYDLRSRVSNIIFGQVPQAYVYPLT